MAPVIILFFLFPTLLVLLAATLGLRNSESRKTKGLNLPPGSMGWPLLGETIAFRRQHPCNSLGEYMEDRINK